MRILEKTADMQRNANDLRAKGKTIGFVPTMGYFHDGHLSLMRASIEECDFTIVSLFVNPTQFAPCEDLDKYPRDFERDKKLAEDVGVDVLFYPKTNEIYSASHSTFVEVFGLSKILCGVTRPTHFRGVATICAKLFNIVKPHRVYFGQKDAQQTIIIKKMIDELDFDIKMRVMPIIRESDGLAMSSRNKYLSADERKRALSLYSSLIEIKKSFDKGKRSVDDLKKFGLKIMFDMIDKQKDKIDYIEFRDAVDLTEITAIERPVLVAAASNIGKTRLIDNVILSP